MMKLVMWEVYIHVRNMRIRIIETEDVLEDINPCTAAIVSISKPSVAVFK